MFEPIQVFRRVEQKYLLSLEQRRALERLLAGRLQQDPRGPQTVASVYYDTPDFALIRRSLEKPLYKEKLRVRSYGRAGEDSEVFVELKKKFQGVVNKRREAMRLRDAEIFLRTGVARHPLSQIQKEIDWFRTVHQAIPAAFVACERDAWLDPSGSGLRLTFDTEVRCRDRDLSLNAPLDGQALLGPREALMEVKARDAMPLWLARALSDLALYPVSFSKYGRYYQQALSTPGMGAGRGVHVA